MAKLKLVFKTSKHMGKQFKCLSGVGQIFLYGNFAMESREIPTPDYVGTFCTMYTFNIQAV